MKQTEESRSTYRPSRIMEPNFVMFAFRYQNNELQIKRALHSISPYKSNHTKRERAYLSQVPER